MQFSQTKIYIKTLDLIDLSQIILRDCPFGYRISDFGFRISDFGYRPLALYRLAFGAPLWPLTCSTTSFLLLKRKKLKSHLRFAPQPVSQRLARLLD